MSGDNYPIDFNISKNRISLIIHLCQKRPRRKKSCNKKICLKNHCVIHLELLATYAILPLFFIQKKKKKIYIYIYNGKINESCDIMYGKRFVLKKNYIVDIG